MNPKIKSLHIYPVKSCRGLNVHSLESDQRGFIGDRRAMIVDAAGKFITQRSHAKMAKIGTAFSSGNLQLKLDERLIDATWSSNRKMCSIWNDQVDLIVAKETANKALSEYLETPVSLVSMDAQSHRTTSGTWASCDVSLSDGYPILVTNTASLRALSEASSNSISMAQFRPNIVIEHDEAWAEDEWKVIRAGNVEIELVKPCTRCQITTLDPLTGEEMFPEIMAAMITHRRSADDRVKGVLFGWNAIFRKTSRLQTGEAVEIVEKRKAWPIK